MISGIWPSHYLSTSQSSRVNYLSAPPGLWIVGALPVKPRLLLELETVPEPSHLWKENLPLCGQKESEGYLFIYSFVFFSEPKLWLLNFIEFINLKYFILFLKFNEKMGILGNGWNKIILNLKKKRVFLGLKENKKIIHSHFINM